MTMTTNSCGGVLRLLFFLDLSDVLADESKVSWYKGDDWYKRSRPKFVWWRSNGSDDDVQDWNAGHWEWQAQVCQDSSEQPSRAEDMVNDTCKSLRAVIEEEESDKVALAGARKGTGSSTTSEVEKRTDFYTSEEERESSIGEDSKDESESSLPCLLQAPPGLAPPPGLSPPPGLKTCEKGGALCHLDDAETSLGSDTSDSDFSGGLASAPVKSHNKICLPPAPKDIPRTRLGQKASWYDSLQ